MSIRVCGGTYRSRRLECPQTGVRPTTDRVKEAIFSTLAGHLQGACVLDLFAGSGNLGIEALSRGACEVTFVDKSAVSVRVIEKNLQALGINEHITCIKSEVSAFVRQCSMLYDLIFMDPPYNKGLASNMTPHVYNLLKFGGILTIEHSPSEIIEINPWKTRTYGDTMITYIMRSVP